MLRKNEILAHMRILAIETSCDETAVSILECSGGFDAPTFSVLGTGLFSQAHLHEKYGGVFPALAKREHQKNLVPLLEIALGEAKLDVGETFSVDEATLVTILTHEQELLSQLTAYFASHNKIPDIDAIAVTQGPGLEPALWVGINFAKALSYVWKKPLIPVNHMEGHIFSVLLNSSISYQLSATIAFPALALLVSGGHTELQLVHDWLSYERLGETRDDAVGEAFDKVARLLGLPYPGGPQISKLAAEARAENAKAYNITLPRPMIKSDDYDFSYAGLKTAVLYATKEHGDMDDIYKKEMAREFEDAAVDVLVAKTKKALEEHAPKTFIVGGGVIGNQYLRERLTALIADVSPETTILLPTKELSTDNAVMIGIAGYFRYEKTPSGYGVFDPSQTLKASGTLRL